MSGAVSADGDPAKTLFGKSIQVFVRVLKGKCCLDRGELIFIVLFLSDRNAFVGAVIDFV